MKEVSIPGSFYSKIYAYEELLVQQCKNRAQLNHVDQVAIINERASKRERGITYTTIAFSGLGIVAGFLSGGALAFPVVAIGAAEIAWMQNDINTQKQRSKERVDKELAREELRCVEDAERLEQELSVLDFAESTIIFNYTSGALLNGLVDIPNGVQTKTSATHISSY